MKIAIEITAEDVTWLRWHLGRVLTLGRIGFVEPVRGDNILARVFDAYVADRDLIDVRTGSVVEYREGREDEAN